MRRIICLLLLAFLAACTQGPGVDALRNDVAAQLEQILPDQGIEVASLERRGSQKDTEAPEGETRRIVYFDAQLKLNKDIDFGAWNSPGISALVSALGAGPKGIEGIKTGGNRAGDTIEAHGTVLYRQEGDAWAPAVPVGYSPPVAAPRTTSDTSPGSAAWSTTLRNMLDTLPRDTSPEQNRIIEQELRLAHQTIRARLARSNRGYAIAAGAEHGQYLRVARALFGADNPRTVPLITQGGEENLQLLRAGKVSLALAQGDAAQDAYEGTGAFSGIGAHTELRSIGSLYPEPLHVIALAQSKLESIAQLRGKRVAIGKVGSASRTTALRVLQAHGLEANDIEPLELSIGEALSALQQGQVDAVMQVIGTPSDSIRELQTHTTLKFLPLAHSAVAQMVQARAGYFPYSISRGVYPSQNYDVPTIAAAALLLTDTTLSDAEVDALTRRVYQTGRDYPGRGSAQGAQISVATSKIGLSVPLHPAAARALNSLEP
ncbi:MAG TPA: TAXI family TRAP transporter solute-binding subunit [Pusillimonas sp.]|uniref:TAXI family TRAP transporter solute-binding subunit n=1 Tax=Pusillimonas sp. TaxID=3040095 RepID=UPI002B8BDADB|nr:TAXI family TRAP transporter solute-binding subunit [Pusillimonas sp.]HUH86437.1 TAXI family TRAP transporter solute-binding subunit [Pusillimonas sp.]